MDRYNVIRGACALMLSALAPAGTLGAEGVRGQLGQQSRSAIRISVRVAPRFVIEEQMRSRSAMQIDPSASWEPIVITTNAPSLRYYLVPEGSLDYRSLFEKGPLHGSSINSEIAWAARRNASSQPRLILIVPD